MLRCLRQVVALVQHLSHERLLVLVLVLVLLLLVPPEDAPRLWIMTSSDHCWHYYGRFLHGTWHFGRILAEFWQNNGMMCIIMAGQRRDDLEAAVRAHQGARLRLCPRVRRAVLQGTDGD